MGTRKLPDTSTGLTEFGPLSSEVKPAGNFFTRLLKRTKDDSDNSSSSSATGSQPSSREPSVERSAAKPLLIAQRTPSRVSLSSAISEDNTLASTGSAEGSLAASKTNDDSGSQSEESSEGTAVDDPRQKRTLSSVLSRLGNILDRRSNTLQTYKDSDFKQYWMPDSSCKECYDCGDKFTTFRRRHHCRICGQIFCSKCCNQELPGKIIGYKGGIRVCTYCCKVVLRYAQQSDSTGDVKVSREDLRSLSIDFESGSFQDLGIWSPNMKRFSSIREDNQQQGSISPQDTSGAGLQKNVPFDLTPHADFSLQESLMKESKIFIQDSIQLRELWRQMNDAETGVEMQSHRIRLKTYHKCIMGKELVNWLLRCDKAANRDQAIAIGQALLFANYLEPISSQLLVFQDDFCLYKAGEHAGLVESSESENKINRGEESISSEPLWFQEIESMDRDDLSISEEQRSSTTDSDQRRSVSSESGSRAVFYLSERSDSGSMPNDLSKLQAMTKDSSEEPLPSTGLSEDFLKGALFVGKSIPASPDNISCPHGWRNAEQLRDENGEKLAYERLRKAHSEMWDAVLKQLLSQHGLSFIWQQVISYIILQVSRFVRPDVQVEGDDPDIRKYVHIKKIPGDQKQDTFMLHGVVFTKNIAHKKMQQQIPNPQILLLKGAIEYQRVENKFSSLEPQILQEREFLKNSVAKIVAFRPSVLIVEKSVSRLAQEFLLDAGITLVFNVKQSVMERVARFTQADIVPSIDSLVGRPKLGFCHSFRCQSYTLPNGELKTVVVLDGCATHLGCTICLRGGTATELRKVKEVLKFMSYTSYNSILETSYCMDEFAMPPPNPEEILLHDDFDLSESTIKGVQTDPVNKLTDSETGKDDSKPEDKTAASQEPTDGKHESVDPENPDLELGSGDDLEEGEVVMRKSQLTENNSEKRTSKEAKHKSVERTELTDLSDPLHSYQHNKDDSIFQSKVAFQEHKQTKQWQFKKALLGLVLSVSPYHIYEVPYLETAHGSKCELRKFLPEDIYWSQMFEGEQSQRSRSKFYDVEYSNLYPSKSNIKITEAHPFILQQLTSPLHENITQTLLADFRARGGRIHVVPPHELRLEAQREFSRKNNITEELAENEKNRSGIHWEKKIDCLDPANHQKMSVLFSSYSHKSANHPNPCVYPWVVKMEFYGNNDITLGGFLERYCFRKSYSCPSVTCDTPMVQHIRRFAHDKGYINVVLKKLDSMIAGGQNNILMWSWCCKCKQVTPVVPISVDTWNLSFAKYLELRFHGKQFSRRASAEPCTHSLHQDHNQYFGYKDIVASFRYSELMLRELALPPIIVSLYQLPGNIEKLKDVVRSITNKGMEKYSAILECTMKLRNEIQSESTARAVSEFVTEQQLEKARLRDLALNVQQKLLDQGGDGDNSGVQNEAVLLEVHDDIILLKRLVAEAVVRWNTKIQDFLTYQQKKYKQQTSLSKKDKDKDSLSVSADEADRSSPRHDDRLIQVRKDSDPPNMDTSEGETSGPSSLSPMPIERGGSSSNLEALRDDDGVDGRLDKKASVRRNWSSFWSGPGFTPITMPFDPAEHYLLPACEKIPVVVYDYEPSSVIAYALSCGDYHHRLRDLQCCFGAGKEPGNSSAAPKCGSKSLDMAGGAVEAVLESEDNDNYSVLTSSTTADMDKAKVNSKQAMSPHIELQFSDSGARFYCKIYFAEPFRQLRKLIFPAGEEMFIRSLCRCKPWEAKGGKSGSSFCKTDDDRFILKQMSGMEVESFEKFGPEYFKSVSRAYREKRPTALAKILGVYRIGFRNTQTNHALKQDLLIMENLFYNRKITQTFDLKGSMRNRLVNTSGKREEELVLLDENLLKLSVESPLYMRPHSKTVLKAAITSDSEFLSSNLVMDYSLLVGIDEVRNELVVGIIDYIRTFTWDKKLEMLVKSQIGIIGGQGKTPTVVSPQLYRSRFLEAMDRYFLHVPDQWSGVGSDFPSPSDSLNQPAQETSLSSK